jgi:hypothetical protein
VASLQVGSYQHQKIFCQLLTENSDFASLNVPSLDELTQKRLGELQFWPVLYGQLQRSSAIAQLFCQSIKGTLIREAIAHLAQEKKAIAEAIRTLCRENQLSDFSFDETEISTAGESDFKAISHQDNMGLFWLSGLYALAIQEQYLQADVLNVFDQLLTIQARHSLFFINWLAFESQVKQKPEFELLGLRSFFPMTEMWVATFTKLNRSDYDDTLPINPTESDYFLGKWSYSEFVQACAFNYQGRFMGSDVRLIQPKALLQAAKLVRSLLGFWPQRVKAIKAPST